MAVENPFLREMRGRYGPFSDPEIVASVKGKYRAINPYDLAVVDSRDTGISQGRKMEFYPPEELLNPIPGRMTVEVFDPEIGGAALDDMVAADFLHYAGKENPYLSGIREEFGKSLTEEQRDIDRRVYERALAGDFGYEETRPFDEWMNIHRLDQYLGSAFLPEGSADRADWMGGMTERQKGLLDEIMRYMRTGVTP